MALRLLRRRNPWTRILLLDGPGRCDHWFLSGNCYQHHNNIRSCSSTVALPTLLRRRRRCSSSSSTTRAALSTTTATATTNTEGPTVGAIRTARATTSSSLSLDLQWERMTHDLLTVPIGDFQPGTWREAEEILTFWYSSPKQQQQQKQKNGNNNNSNSNRNNSYKTNVENCWLILDRLYVELQHNKQQRDTVEETGQGTNSSRVITTTQKEKTRPPYPPTSPSPSRPRLSTMGVLNPIMVLWRHDFLATQTQYTTNNNHHTNNNNNTPTRRLPSTIAQQLYQYAHSKLVYSDAATHGILLDVAGKYSSSVWARTISQKNNTHNTDKNNNNNNNTNASVTTTTTTSPLLLKNNVGTSNSKSDNNNNPNANTNDNTNTDNPHTEGILFADGYLRKWMQEYLHYAGTKNKKKLPASTAADSSRAPAMDRDVVVARPDIVALGTVVHGWVEATAAVLGGVEQRRRQAQAEEEEIPRRVEAWLHDWDRFEYQLQELHNSHNNYDSKAITPTNTPRPSKRKLYASVVLAWARCGNAQKARMWIKRMLAEGDYPDLMAWNALLMAYQHQAAASSSNEEDDAAAEHAEAVLRYMLKLYHQHDGSLVEPPNVVSYSIVIDTWAKRSTARTAAAAGTATSTGNATHNKHRRNNSRVQHEAKKNAQRAHDWLERMKTVEGASPNTITYNTVITAYSRAGYPEHAEALLSEMLRATTTPATTTVSTPPPDVQSFTSVLAGYARIGTLAAAERADELLRILQQPDMGIAPTVNTYNACIQCWARVAEGNPRKDTLPSSSSNNNNRHTTTSQHQERALRRVEQLYHELQSQQNIQPDVYAYTSVLNAYGKSGRAEKAQDFLEICLQDYATTNHPAMKPTAFTLTAILNAWSKAAAINPRAADTAHALLHRMMDEYGIAPNLYSVSIVIDAYARTDRPDSAEKALQLFHDMRTSFHLEPNSYACTNVLKALCRGGRVEEAETLLIDLVQDENRRTLQLGPHAFCSVLNGWSKSKQIDAAERAEDLLVQMQQLYEQSRIEKPPNTICVNNVLHCWAHSNLPGAANRADRIFRSINQQEQDQKQQEASYDNDSNTSTRRQYNQNLSGRDRIRCNRIMYNTVMNAWANAGNVARVHELYEELVEKGQLDRDFLPDIWTYKAVWKSVINSNNVQREERHQRLQALVKSMHDSRIQLSRDMKTDIHQIRRQLKHKNDGKGSVLQIYRNKNNTQTH